MFENVIFGETNQVAIKKMIVWMTFLVLVLGLKNVNGESNITSKVTISTPNTTKPVLDVMPLHKACLKYSDELIHLIKRDHSRINQEDSTGKTPLHYAVTGGDIRCIKLLVENGADINHKDATGITPIVFASTNVQNLEYLIDRGANIHVKSTVPTSPLLMAVLTGKKESVELLMKHGANINQIIDDRGQTVLDYALSTTIVSKDMIALIESHGASVGQSLTEK